MPKHNDVFVFSSELIDLMLPAFDDHEIAAELGTTTEKDEWECDSVVDPQCWCRVSWPEHVLTPRFNSDAIYHRADADEIDEKSIVHWASAHRR